jgi:hypothetical protein
MVTEYSVGTLYIDGVWATYNSLAGRSINVGPWHVTTNFRTLFRYNNHSSSDALDDPTSIERTTIAEITALFDTLRHLPEGRPPVCTTSETRPAVCTATPETLDFLDHLDPNLQNVAIASMPKFQIFIQDATTFQL